MEKTTFYKNDSFFKKLRNRYTYATFILAFSTNDLGFKILFRTSWVGENGLLANDVSSDPFSISNDVTFPFISDLLYPFFQVPFCCETKK